ncbi:replicative DNA helicase [Lachnospiraceae bacterium NE2001]|nr:replicative DNA helicase [Lachnospiraceae bacterium NE2001]
MAEENIIKKIPPHDSDAEKSVISSMLADRDAISEVSAILLNEDFYNPQYGLIFDAIVKLYNEGRPVDDVVLGDKLREMGAPESVSNLGFLGEILASNATAAFAVDYAQIVKDKSYLRKLIKFSDKVTANAYEARENVDTIMDKAEADIFSLMNEKNNSGDQKSMEEIVSNVIIEIEQATRKKGEINGLRTGFKNLDYMLTGLHGGELIIIAARPGMGKTAFVLNIAHHVAIREKTPIALFNLEMTAEQLVTRLMAVDSMVEAGHLKTGDINDSEWGKILESTQNLNTAPLFIDDNSSITLNELRTKCRKLKQTKNIGLIVIDYLQLMNSTGKVESRQLFIAEVSRALKSLAKELNVPIIALSQLNRAVDTRQDHRPTLADLRESGAIEQDADVVMFIYRDDEYNKESEKPGVAEIIVAKQRNGSTGTVELVWIGKYTKFANINYGETSAS